MTDNRTTELRRLLDERGVEHEDSELIDHRDGTTTYYTEWGGNDDGDGSNVYIEYMDGTVLRMFDATPEQAIAATLGSGTLTAEQVSKATYAHSIHADCADADWHAIADELNAELGSGTCEMEWASDWMGWHCKACDSLRQGLPDQKPNFCPNCGREVVNEC